MERSNSMKRGKRSLDDEGDEEQPQQSKRKRPALARIRKPNPSSIITGNDSCREAYFCKIKDNDFSETPNSFGGDEETDVVKQAMGSRAFGRGRKGKEDTYLCPWSGEGLGEAPPFSPADFGHYCTVWGYRSCVSPKSQIWLYHLWMLVPPPTSNENNLTGHHRAPHHRPPLDLPSSSPAIATRPVIGRDGSPFADHEARQITQGLAKHQGARRASKGEAGQ
ncbi:hypothetical protein Drorol1_Dr00000800 [Drosera rotundifolia]